MKTMLPTGTLLALYEVGTGVPGANETEHILPHLEPLKFIHNFTVESQLLYHAPLTFEPIHDETSLGMDMSALNAASSAASAQKAGSEDGVASYTNEEEENAWLIDQEQVKLFVNSERWSLDSGSTNNPVLRFLLFVPAAKHRPLRLAGPGEYSLSRTDI
jgi:phosphatidylinositol glycan class S